jgi:hypothetical protein
MLCRRILRRAVGASVLVSGLSLAGGVQAQTPPAPPVPAHQSLLETAVGPFYAVGAWLAGWVGWAESAVIAEKRAFIDTLKNDLARFERLVGLAGFKVSEVRIAGGFAPEISLTLEMRTDITDEEEAAFRRRINEDFAGAGLVGRIERGLLLALLDVDDAAAAIRPDGYVLSEIEVDVDILPSFSYAFTPATAEIETVGGR